MATTELTLDDLGSTLARPPRQRALWLEFAPTPIRDLTHLSLLYPAQEPDPIFNPLRLNSLSPELEPGPIPNPTGPSNNISRLFRESKPPLSIDPLSPAMNHTHNPPSQRLKSFTAQ